jgi:hypothetical protein
MSYQQKDQGVPSSPSSVGSNVQEERIVKVERRLDEMNAKFDDKFDELSNKMQRFMEFMTARVGQQSASATAEVAGDGVKAEEPLPGGTSSTAFDQEVIEDQGESGSAEPEDGVEPVAEKNVDKSGTTRKKATIRMPWQKPRRTAPRTPTDNNVKSQFFEDLTNAKPRRSLSSSRRQSVGVSSMNRFGDGFQDHFGSFESSDSSGELKSSNIGQYVESQRALVMQPVKQFDFKLTYVTLANVRTFCKAAAVYMASHATHVKLAPLVQGVALEQLKTVATSLGCIGVTDAFIFQLGNEDVQELCYEQLRPHTQLDWIRMFEVNVVYSFPAKPLTAVTFSEHLSGLMGYINIYREVYTDMSSHWTDDKRLIPPVARAAPDFGGDKMNVSLVNLFINGLPVRFATQYHTMLGIPVNKMDKIEVLLDAWQTQLLAHRQQCVAIKGLYECMRFYNEAVEQEVSRAVEEKTYGKVITWGRRNAKSDSTRKRIGGAGHSGQAAAAGILAVDELDAYAAAMAEPPKDTACFYKCQMKPCAKGDQCPYSHDYHVCLQYLESQVAAFKKHGQGGPVRGVHQLKKPDWKQARNAAMSAAASGQHGAAGMDEHENDAAVALLEGTGAGDTPSDISGDEN